MQLGVANGIKMRKGWMCVLANSQNQEQVEHVGDESLRTTCNF